MNIKSVEVQPVNRRALICMLFAGTAATLLLTRCANKQGAIDFATVRAYADDLVDAMGGAAQSYALTKPTPSPDALALVSDVMRTLLAAKSALDGATPSSDAKTIILEVISGVQTLTPYLAMALGGAAPYVPIAIALLQAFINNLPAPPDAPPQPPAALHHAAALHRASHR